jgi:glycosyltransferase involved in cell wall biosynthesis
MKQRVLFAIDEMSGGGSQRQILGILKHLNRQNFEPELYVVSDHGELLSEVPADVPIHIFERRHSAPIGRLPGSGFRARARDLAKLLDERQIQLIYDRTYHTTLITGAATRKRPTPRISVIVTDPKLDFDTNPERFRRIKRRLLRNAYRDADVVAAVSEGVRTAAAAYHRIPLDRIETVYNFFDVDQIDRLSRQELPGQQARDKNVFGVAAAGRLHRQKGFDVLIAAAREVVHEYGHQQFSLVILGTGESRSQLEQQLREARLEAHVQLAGFQINPLPIYRDSDLFVLSSRYEGMPNALVEAMLCEVPVISTDCPSGPSEILQGGQLGGLVPVEDASALAAAIDDAITNHPQWQQRSEEARARIVERFSAESGIERVAELFERAIARFGETGR